MQVTQHLLESGRATMVKEKDTKVLVQSLRQGDGLT